MKWLDLGCTRILESAVLAVGVILRLASPSECVEGETRPMRRMKGLSKRHNELVRRRLPCFIIMKLLYTSSC